VKKISKSQPCHIDPDDAELFRAAVGKVKPLKEQNRIIAKATNRKTVVRSLFPSLSTPNLLHDRYSAEYTSSSPVEEVPSEFLRNGLSKMTLRKMRRQNGPIQDRLDLHGLKRNEARKLLQQFLYESTQRKLRCVLVIHGKGINSSGGEAVLRKFSRHWLTCHPSVLGYCDAPARGGGNGAVLILLKTGSNAC